MKVSTLKFYDFQVPVSDSVNFAWIRIRSQKTLWPVDPNPYQIIRIQHLLG